MPLSDITPMTWTDGNADLTDSNFNTEIRDSYGLLLSPPAAGINYSTNQTVTSATWTAITFDTLLYDTLSTDTPQWDAGSPNKLTCQVDGWYEVVASATFNNPAGLGVIIGAIRLGPTTSGTSLYGGSSVSTNGTTFGILDVCVNVLMQLTAGDDIYFMIYQNTGGGSLTLTQDGYSPIFTMTRRRGI